MGKSRDAREVIESVLIAEEDFLVDVQHAIQWLMNDRAVTQASLADELGISEARVSQMFGASAKNLTIRTIARIFHVLGDKCEITSSRLQELKAALAHASKPQTKSDQPAQKAPTLIKTPVGRREPVDQQWVIVGLRQTGDSRFTNDNAAHSRGRGRGRDREPRAA